MVCTDAVETIWGGMEGEILVVLPEIEDLSDTVGGAALGEGSAYSLTLLMNVLQHLYHHPQLSVHLCLDVQQRYEKANLVLIGGPESNFVTRKILSDHRVKDKLDYMFDGYKLVDKHSEKSYEANITSDVTKGVSGIDYGFVWKGSNPFAESKRVYILAGSRTFGTLAAAAALCDMRFMEKFVQKFGNEGFQIIVERRDIGHRTKDITSVLYPEGLTQFQTISVAQIQTIFGVLPRPAYHVEALPRLTSADIIIAAALIFGGFIAVFFGVTRNMSFFSVPGFLAVAAGIWHILVQGR